jgi:hypothetical protein
MYFSHPYYYPYTTSIHREERRNLEHIEQLMAKHISIAEEIQRRMVSIDERFERMEKTIQKGMSGNSLIFNMGD